MNAFALTSRPTGVMLLTRRQPFYPSAAHDKFFSICTAFGGYTEFGIVPGHSGCNRGMPPICYGIKPKKDGQGYPFVPIQAKNVGRKHCFLPHISFLSTGPLWYLITNYTKAYLGYQRLI